MVYQFGNRSYSLDPPVLILYAMAIMVVLLSGGYALVLPLVNRSLRGFVYFQICVDTLCVKDSRSIQLSPDPPRYTRSIVW